MLTKLHRVFEFACTRFQSLPLRVVPRVVSLHNHIWNSSSACLWTNPGACRSTHLKPVSQLLWPLPSQEPTPKIPLYLTSHHLRQTPAAAGCGTLVDCSRPLVAAKPRRIQTRAELGRDDCSVADRYGGGDEELSGWSGLKLNYRHLPASLLAIRYLVIEEGR